MADSDYQDSGKHRKRDWGTDYWESRIFGAFTMILVGVILLMNTTGTLPWSVWLNIFRYWPLFIVSAGISIIFSGSRVMKFIGSIISFVIFLAIVGLAVFNPLGSTWWPFSSDTVSADARSATYMIKSDEYLGVTSKIMNINLPVGSVSVTDGAGSNYLDASTSYYLDREKLIFTKSMEGLALRVDITTDASPNLAFDTRGPKYKFVLGQRAIPAALNLKFGAGSGHVEMTNQLLSKLTADVGAGSLEVILGAESIPAGEFSLKSGVGSIKLQVPAALGLRLNYKVGLGSVTVNNQKVNQGVGNGTYVIQAPVGAETVEIDVETGVGSIEITTN